MNKSNPSQLAQSKEPTYIYDTAVEDEFVGIVIYNLAKRILNNKNKLKELATRLLLTCETPNAYLKAIDNSLRIAFTKTISNTYFNKLKTHLEFVFPNVSLYPYTKNEWNVDRRQYIQITIQYLSTISETTLVNGSGGQCIDLKKRIGDGLAVDNSYLKFRRYIMISKLSKTLQGGVYVAYDKVSKKYVAIKKAMKRCVNNAIRIDGSPIAEDFKQEVRKMVQFDSDPSCPQSIMTARDVFIDYNSYNYVMQLGEECLLNYVNQIHEIIKKRFVNVYPSTWETNVKTIMRQICVAEKWLITKGYCNNDYSMENILIMSYNPLRVKIMDFGLMSAHRDGIFVKEAGSVVGKWAYMSHEMFNKQGYDGRLNNVACIGIILFGLLVGGFPYGSRHERRKDKCSEECFVNGRVDLWLDSWDMTDVISDDGVDLINNMVRMEKYRFNIDQVLKHPFLKQESVIEKLGDIDGYDSASLSAHTKSECDNVYHKSGDDECEMELKIYKEGNYYIDLGMQEIRNIMTTKGNGRDNGDGKCDPNIENVFCKYALNENKKRKSISF